MKLSKTKNKGKSQKVAPHTRGSQILDLDIIPLRFSLSCVGSVLIKKTMAASLLESPFLSNRQLFSTTHHSFQPQKPIPIYYCVPFSRSSSACPLRLCAVGENVDSLALTPLAKVVAEDSVQDNRVSLERSKDRRKVVKLAWEKLVRWSRYWRSKAKTDVLERTKKVANFSF